MKIEYVNDLFGGTIMNKAEISRRAEILKVMSHPDRLCILRGLCLFKCNVGEIQKKLGLSQSGLSQHLSKLRNLGIIHGERKGKQICYQITDAFALRILNQVFDGIDDKDVR